MDAKLKDIVNSAFNLGECIAESKIVRKILRSLPKRFHTKITYIEEVKDIDQIPLTKLVRDLQTYEMGLGLKYCEGIFSLKKTASTLIYLDS